MGDSCDIWFKLRPAIGVMDGMLGPLAGITEESLTLILQIPSVGEEVESERSLPLGLSPNWPRVGDLTWQTVLFLILVSFIRTTLGKEMML